MRFGATARAVIRVFFARGAGGVLGIGIAALIANRFGAGAPSDAFYLIRRLTLGLTEAANQVIVVVYVPPLVASLRASRHESVRNLWGRHLTRVLGPTTVLAIALAVLAPWIVVLFAPGFDSEREHLATALLRILIFAIPLHLAFSALASVLYAFRRFGVPEAAGTLPRLAAFIVLLLLIPPLNVTALGWALLGGTALAVLLLTPTVGFALRSKSASADSAMAQDQIVAGMQSEIAEEPNFRKRLLPAIVFQGYRQISGWIDFAFASVVAAGAVSIIEYAQRLAFILPTLLMSSFFTVLYAELAHDAAAGGAQKLRRGAAVTLRAGLFLLVPFALFLLVAAEPVVDLVFKHGAFDDDTASLTTTVIKIFAPAFVMAFVIRTLNVGIYADENAPHLAIVVRLVATGLVVRIVLLAMLPRFLGVAGIAWAILVSALAVSSVAYYLVAQQWGPLLQKQDLKALGKMVAGAALAWLGMFVAASTVHPQSNSGQIALVLLLAVAGAALYLTATSLLGVEEARALRSMLRRRRIS